MSNVISISRSLFWSQTPAAKRVHALKDKWDALPERTRSAYETEPKLWALCCLTHQQRDEIHELHERILFGEDVSQAEKRAMLCRLDHLDPEQAIKRHFDENGDRLPDSSTWWRAPIDPSAA